MKSLLKTMTLLVLLLMQDVLSAQSLVTNQEELHNRYKTYRERFRKYFTVIGDRRGNGLPFSDIEFQGWIKAIEVDISGNPVGSPRNPNTHGKLNVGGDVTYFFAEYLGILSSEYWLLKRTGQQNSDAMKGVLNELYYTLFALERLDQYSNEYFTPGITGTASSDGFFVRDDTEPKIIQDAFSMHAYPRLIWETGTNSTGWELLASPPTDKDNLKFIANYEDDALNYPVRIANVNDDKYIHYIDEETEQSRLNEMSMDQLIGVLFGLKCVSKFIDSDVEVDPDGTGSLEKKNIINWVKDYTDKLMTHLTRTTNDIDLRTDEEIEEWKQEKCKKMHEKPWVNISSTIRYNTQNECEEITGPFSCRLEDCSDWNTVYYKPVTIAREANYVVTNPSFGNRPVLRGPYAFIFGYPLEKIGEEITGNDYSAVSVKLSKKAQVARYALIFSINLSPDFYSSILLGRLFQPSNPSWWRDIYNNLPRNELVREELRKSTAAGMLIWLPAASNTWTQDEYFDLMTAYDRKEAEIIWAVLNNKKPKIQSYQVENILLSSECSGCQNSPTRFDKVFNRTNFFSKIASDGNRTDEETEEIIYDKNWVDKEHDSQQDRDREIWYNGLDWMLLYNFYRISGLNYSSEGWESSDYNKKNESYNDNTCPCQSSYNFHYGTISSNVTDPHTVARMKSFEYHYSSVPSGATNNVEGLIMFNPAYEKLGIHLSDWLVKSFTVQNGKALIPEGNLRICNNGNENPTSGVKSRSIVTVEDGATIGTSENTDNTIYKVIRFGKNSTLLLESGATLFVQNNTKVVFDAGAELMYEDGASVVLDGPNAILEFNHGSLRIDDGAEFTISGGSNGRGYLHFHYDYDEDPTFASIHGGTSGTSKFKLEGSYSTRDNYSNDKILEVTGNIGLKTDWYLKNFVLSKGFVAMGKGSKIISNADYTLAEYCHVNVLNNSSSSDYFHGGFEIPGRFNDFNEVQIWHAEHGISYYNRGGQGRLNISSCYFEKCKIPVYQIGGIFKIDNCYVPGATPSTKLGLFGYDYGILANGMSGISTLRNSEVSNSVGRIIGWESQALRYKGTGQLYMWKNFISGGRMGLNAADARVRIKCNIFRNNGWNTYFNKSPSISLQNGYNVFEGGTAWTHIHGYGKTWFSLANGYNDFRSLSNANDLIFDVVLSTNSPWDKSLNTLEAKNNSFDNRTINPWNPPSTSRPYLISTIEAPNTQLRLSYIPDLYSTINMTITDQCQDNKEYEPLELFGHSLSIPVNPNKYYNPSEFMVQTGGSKNSTNVRASGPFASTTVTKSLGDLILNNVNRVYYYTDPANDSTIAELSNVFRNNVGRADLKDSANLVDVTLLYGVLKDAYSYEALELDKDSGETSFGQIAPYYNQLDTMYRDMWMQSYTSNSVWNDFRYEIITDWAQLNRLANNRLKAIAILDTGIIYSEDTVFSRGYRDWKCINQFEISLQSDTSLSLDTAISLCPCILNINKDIDTTHLEQSDTVVYYCDWENTLLKKATSFLWNDPGNIVSLNNLESPIDIIKIDSSGSYRFKEGNYRIIYYDTTTLTTSALNMTVVGDTIPIVDSTISISYCDMNQYGIHSRITYLIDTIIPYLVFNDSTNLEYRDTQFSKGSYTIYQFDTLNCLIYRTKLLVGTSAPTINHIDSTINEYNPFDITLDEFVSSLGPDYYGEKLNDLSANPFLACIKGGQYLFVNPDSANCEVDEYDLIVMGDTADIDVRDTTVYYCDFEDSTFSSYYYYLPVDTLPYLIYSTGDDTILLGSNRLTEGNYLIFTFDSLNCRINKVNMAVEANSVDVTSSDTTIGYCGPDHSGSENCVVFVPSYTYKFQIKQFLPDTFIYYDTCLYEGFYKAYVYNDDSCLINIIEVTVLDSVGCAVPFMGMGIDRIGKQHDVWIYPNPGDGYFRVGIKNEVQVSQVEIFNLIGELIENYKETEIGQNFDISDISTGTYIVKITTSYSVYNFKLIISR